MVGFFLLCAAGVCTQVSCSPLLSTGEKAGAAGFSGEWLREEAKALAEKPYAAPKNTLPAWVRSLDWDQYQSIRYRPENSLWRGADLPFQLQFFHLGLYFHHPVAMHEVVNGKSYPIHYTNDLFTYGAGVEVPPKVGDLGFAGFRVYGASDLKRDLVAFLGASYFRAVGQTKQYGISARGLAVDTGLGRAEEFPWFKAFWLERPAPGSRSMTVHALLDSPSVSGAYTFVIAPDDQTVMDVECHLFPRVAIERVGIAPLTSM